MSDYVPKRGDIVWLNLSPQAGHEQAGRRPVVVLSPESYNARTGLAVVCPLTTKVKGYAFEVASEIGGERGAVLADQIKSVDWVARQAQYFDRLSTPTVDRTAIVAAALIGGLPTPA